VYQRLEEGNEQLVKAGVGPTATVVLAVTTAADPGQPAAQADRSLQPRDVAAWQRGRIERFAGTGLAGYRGDGSPAALADLNGPAGLAIDARGNVVIADLRNHAIRRVDARSRVITTVAGCGQRGFAGDDGSALAAKLDAPEGVSVDPTGNVVIADSGNHRLRRVDARTGIITTVAGTGATLFNGHAGAALTINLNHPSGVVVDERGVIDVGDYGNDLIRAVTPAGELFTLVGTGRVGYDGDGGPATAATLNDVYGIGLGPQGDLYLIDSLNFAVRRVARDTGLISTVPG
jgi:sugar lactone lactonase YvrE